MNFCPNCGNKLSPSDVLCSRCGSLIERVKSTVNKQPICKPQILPPAGISDTEEDLTLPGQISIQDLVAPQSNEPKQTYSNEKQWLEIEELDAPALPAEAAAPIEDTIGVTPDVPADEPVAETEAVAVPIAEEPKAAAAEVPIKNDTMRPNKPDNAARKPSSTPREKTPKKHIPVVVVFLLWVLTTAAVFAGSYFAEIHVTENYGDWDGFVRDVTKGKVEMDISSAYMSSIKVDVSETETKDGAPAHQFKVDLADGKSVSVKSLQESHPMQNGSVSFTVSDEALAKSLGVVTSNATMETSGISLEVQTSSQSFNYPITSLTLKLTDAQYKREKPSAETLTTTDTGLKIALTVSPDATVFINNENNSAKIDDFGHLTATMPLELGDNLFVIEVIQPGRRSVKENFTITRELPQIAFSLRDVYLRVFDSAFECRGTTQAGASVTAQLDGKKFTALVGSDGVFSCACTLENTGVYQMEVTASKEGLADATGSVMVEYLPAQATYIEKAKLITVDKIVKDMSVYKDADIKTMARIDGNIKSENHTQTFDVKSKEGAVMKCYYYGPEHLSAELEYTFYGRVDTEKKSFYVMFVE